MLIILVYWFIWFYSIINFDSYIYYLYIHTYLLLTIYPHIPHYGLSFLKIIPKSIFYQRLQEEAHSLISTAFTVTLYPYLGDLHTLLFILHVFREREKERNQLGKEKSLRKQNKKVFRGRNC